MTLKLFLSSKRNLSIAAAICVPVFVLLLASPLHLASRLRLGYAITSTLQGADRVETFRVISPVEVQSPEMVGKPKVFPANAPMIEHCYLTATGPTEGKAFADQIRDVLLDESTYPKDSLACIMQPGVVFRVWKQTRYVDVVLCFHCGEMQVIPYDANGRMGHGIYTLMGGRSHEVFAQLARSAFPNDPDLRPANPNR